MSDNFNWYKPLANHMWRAYFSVIRSGADLDSDVKRRKYDACHAVYILFPERDRNIIKAYYTAKWGDAAYIVDDYSARHGIPVPAIYALITKSQRAVVEQLGLIESEGRKSL